MSIEAAVRTMLTAGSTITLVPDERITLGFRLQDSALPAITYSCTSSELLTIGTSPLRSVSIEVRSVAETSLAALAISAQVRSACAAGDYGAFEFNTVIEVSHTLEPAIVADGDELQPAESIDTFTIIYSE